jgi:hypothetical protein
MNYQGQYDKLVNAAKNRVLGGYVEKHHVVPRAHGGSNVPENIVSLTAREHFVAHWLLWKIHRNRSMARAFRLMVDDQKRPRSRSYVEAKACYAASMRGENNTAKRPVVREKISANNARTWSGQKRPEQARKMRERYASGDHPLCMVKREQRGANNASAVTVRLVRGDELLLFSTSKEASAFLGISQAAVSAARRRNGNARGWAVRGAE